MLLTPVAIGIVSERGCGGWRNDVDYLEGRLDLVGNKKWTAGHPSKSGLRRMALEF